MRVHQPGSHLTRGGRAQVEDWSWAQTKRRLSALYRLARPYKGRTAIAIGSLLGATAVSLVPPYLVGRTVDEVGTGNTDTLGWLVAAFVAAGVLGIAFSYAQTYFTGWTGERMLADLRSHLFRHLQRLSLGFYERNRAGVIISRLTNDVEALDQLVTDGVTSLVQNTLLLVGTAVVLFFLDWRLALATLVIMPVMALATAWFRKRSGRAYRSVRETLGAVTATLAEDIAGMRVLQSFTRERAARENFRDVSDRYRDSNMQTVVLSGIYFPVVDFLSSAATAVVLGYGGYLAFNDEMTIGVLIAFLGYLTNFFDPVQQLSQLYNTFLSAVAALDKITDLLDEEPEVRDDARRRRARPDRRPRHLRRRPLRLRPRPGGAARDRPRGAGRHDGRARRPHRAPASRRSRSCSPASTTRPRAASRSTASICARSPRLRCDASSGSCRRKASSSPARVAENIAFGRPEATTRGDRRRRARRRRRRVHRAARGRLRDAARRARLAAVARPAAAGRVRPRAPRRSAHPDPRRGDELGRHRHRAQDRAARCGGSSTAAPRSSSPTGCRRSATPT